MHPDPKTDRRASHPHASGSRRSTSRGVSRCMAMAVYHFTWDLEFFGYAPPGMTGHRRLEALCPLHRVELPVSGRRQPGSWPISRIRWPGFWQAGDGGRRGGGDFRRDLFRRAGELSSSSASCIRSRWQACWVWPSCACQPLLTLAVAAAVIARPNIFCAPVLRSPGAGGGSACQTIRLRSNDYVPLFPVVRCGADRHCRGADGE